MTGVLSKLPGTGGAWKQRWVLSYVFDYVIVIVLILTFSALDFAEPHHQHFSLNNESLQYPFAEHERITPLWAGVISCLFPLLAIVFWTMILDGRFSNRVTVRNRRKLMAGPWTLTDRLWEMNCGILGLGLSVAGAICVTGALKNVTGKPRPDLISRCNPDKDERNREIWGLVTSAICNQPDNKILKDGFRSWPSGHSSTAFAGLGYLSLFMAGKLHVLDNRGEVWKTVLVLVPLLSAGMVAISRIMDARHHGFDVISGSLLGQLTAWIAYRQYFPSITDSRAKGRAYSHRTWGTDKTERQALGLYETPESEARLAEEGRFASSESLDEPGFARKRAPAGMVPGAESGDDVYELDHQRRPSPFADEGRVARRKTAPMPPMHAPGSIPEGSTAYMPPSKSTNPFEAEIRRDTEDQDSLDMGDQRHGHGHGSPEGAGRPLRVGRLSPPPATLGEDKDNRI